MLSVWAASFFMQNTYYFSIAKKTENCYNDYVDVEIGQSLISTANSVNSQTITAGN